MPVAYVILGPELQVACADGCNTYVAGICEVIGHINCNAQLDRRHAVEIGIHRIGQRILDIVGCCQVREHEFVGVILRKCIHRLVGIPREVCYIVSSDVAGSIRVVFMFRTAGGSPPVACG